MSRRKSLHEILDKRRLYPVFQPILDLQQGQVVGFEGLIRGPQESELHLPEVLFPLAGQLDLRLRLEVLSLQAQVETFVARGMPGKLFLNLSLYALMTGALADQAVKKLLGKQGGLRERVVLEISENPVQADHVSIVENLAALRDKGFRYALNDVGESAGCLRLWLDTRPDYIKLGRPLVSQIDADVTRHQFVRSIKQMAEKSNARLIAVGIELPQQLVTLKSMGVCYGQGNLIGVPAAEPANDFKLDMRPEWSQMFYAANASAGRGKTGHQRGQRAHVLLTEAPTVTPQTSSEAALQILLANPELNVLPVIDQSRPVGLLNRTMVDKFSHGYIRDLHSRKSCTVFMDDQPLVVDINMPVVALSQLVLLQGRKRFGDGFILVSDGKYVGVGSNFSLMQEITRQQIQEARYANPLTLLPGNVPISEQMQALLDSGQRFQAAYVDLDNFKPFNDVFGYRRGDDLIKLTANILVEFTQPEIDFVGHVGGDDFFILLQSDDWALICRNILASYDRAVSDYVREQGLDPLGYVAEDRRGNRMEYSWPTLSIGVVPVHPGQFHEIHEISAVAAEVKKAAKQISGSSLYIDQRGGEGRGPSRDAGELASGAA